MNLDTLLILCSFSTYCFMNSMNLDTLLFHVQYFAYCFVNTMSSDIQLISHTIFYLLFC